MASSTLALSSANHDHPNDLGDDQLIARAKSGHRSAFDELCLRYSQRIRRVTYRITRNREDGEDALQEAYLKAFLHLNSFEGRSSFLSWLTRIAINSALMHLRRKRGREVAFDELSDETTLWAWKPWGYAETPEKQYMRQEAKRHVENAILGLSRASREIIKLRANEHSTQEIADTLGISLPAAKTRLSRARIAIRTKLAGRKLNEYGHRYLGRIDTR